MLITLPRKLTHDELGDLLKANYEPSFSEASCTFDWTNTEWISLPEALTVLNWASKLVSEGIEAEWLIWEPQIPTNSLEASRSLAAEILGPELYRKISNTFEKLDQQTRDGLLTPSDFRSTQSQLQQWAHNRQRKIDPLVEEWLHRERLRFRSLDVLSYLNRYGFFASADAARVTTVPEFRKIPRFNIRPAADTACLSLQPVQSHIEVQSVISQLNDPKALARILGDYAGLDVARGGALAAILVTELGGNIEDHAEATAAWICTRLVLDRNVRQQTGSDPTVKSFRDHQKGFLEIIVCDNGSGLTNDLEKVLANERRDAALNKYASGELPREVQLIDYSFDRLSSSKRDIAQLVHLENSSEGLDATTPKPKSPFVSSGLYWVWNVVRSHKGVLSVLTSGFHAWYDFTQWGDGKNSQGWRLMYPAFQRSGTHVCGTMIRICLPIAQDRLSRSRTTTNYQIAAKAPSQVQTSRFSFVWIGDLAHLVPLKPPPKKSRQNKNQGTARLPGISDGHEMRLLHELQRNHFPLKDGDVLVFDICGVRTEWAKHSVAPLCQFVLEMNYTSTIGRSAVVLWNVPSSSEQVFELAIKLRELFEKNLEEGNTKHSHLREFRRAVLMVFDNEQIRIFCGWSEAEEILSRLRQDAELDLDEIGASRLSAADRDRLEKLITENSHLFEWKAKDRVQLRIWPAAIRVEAWRQNIAWLNALLDRGIASRGVRLVPKKGYFRLPSTGQLVKEFYQFRGLFADHEACAKMAWLVAQVINAIEVPRENSSQTPLQIVSISRSTMALAYHLRDNYYYDADGQISSVIAERTIEELEAVGGNPNVKGNAILITDVISSGHLCDRIALAFPKLNWLKTITLLETRDNAPLTTAELKSGIELYQATPTATGPVYALAVRKVEKFNRTDLGDVPITAIDEVNVCAVETFDKRGDAQEDFWGFIESKPEALKVGHHVGNNHHYVYKVDVGKILQATKPNGQSLLKVIVDRVEADLRRKHYSPDNTVIMHPPHDHSHAEKIARAVQVNSGVLYRHVLYKDNFAGHWRFSPFVHHGVPLNKSTLVLIDDGTNTGETLMGLLDAATFGTPHDVLAYVGVTRMPPHKNHLFTSLKELRSITGTVKVEFILELSIPVYSPRECPICRLIARLTQVAADNPLLRRYAQTLREQLVAQERYGEDRRSKFLWAFSSEETVTRLRESLETLDYHVPSSSHVDAILERAVDVGENESHKNTVLDLAFIVCSEPDLASATVFAPYLESRERGLVEASLHCVKDCIESHLMTFIGFAFHLTARSYQRMPSRDFTSDLSAFWIALFTRREVTTEILGKIISFILAEASRETFADPNTQKARFCHRLLQQLRDQVNPRGLPVDKLNSTAISKAFAYLFIREALVPARELRLSGSADGSSESQDLFDVARQVASQFWWHSSDYVKANISLLADALAADSASTQDRLYGPIHSLIVSFDDLYELQERIDEAERKSKEETNEILGTKVYWDTPELNDAIAKFMRSLVEIAEESGGTDGEFRPDPALIALQMLSTTWEHLTSHLGLAFEEIFPEVQGVVERIWGEFVNLTELPESIAQPLNIDPSVSRAERVFMPRTLLLRFLDATLKNLKTSAFSGWASERLVSAAQARVELFSTTDGSNRKIVSLRIVDNGPSQQQKPRPGEGRGLKNIRLMAKHFGAEVIGPYLKDDHTFVELRMRSRETGGSEK